MVNMFHHLEVILPNQAQFITIKKIQHWLDSGTNYNLLFLGMSSVKPKHLENLVAQLFPPLFTLYTPNPKMCKMQHEYGILRSFRSHLLLEQS